MANQTGVAMWGTRTPTYAVAVQTESVQWRVEVRDADGPIVDTLTGSGVRYFRDDVDCGLRRLGVRRTEGWQIQGPIARAAVEPLD